MRPLATRIARSLAATADRTDGDLLAGFLTRGSDADFAELVRRHGPVVWGVCRRLLPDPADAEDAFQAVFVVLVRRGRRLVASPTLGPWLHRVAAWTARNVRRRNARRLAKREPLPDQLPSPASDPDLSLDLDAALLGLPEKYRSPIVLCHLLGFTRAEAADRLGCPEGTLSSWLSRGLDKLRHRLGGLDPTKVLGVAAVAVPAGLSGSAVRAAAASRVAVAVGVSSTVSQIVEGVVHMFWIKKATAATAALFTVFALGAGVGMSGRQAVGVADGQEKGAGEKPAQPTTPATDPTAGDHAAKLRALEKQIEETRAGLDAALKGAKLTVDRLEIGKDRLAPDDLRRDLETLARLQRKADVAAEELKVLQQDYEQFKAADPQPKPKQPLDPFAQPKQPADPAAKPKGADPFADPQPKPALNDLDKQLADLTVQLDRLQRERVVLAAQSAEMLLKAKELDRAVEDLRAKAAAIQDKRAELTRPQADAGKGGAYLELTVHGKDAEFPFSLNETDSAGRYVVQVTVREPAMLSKVFLRTKADPNAPKELRITVLQGASLEAIKAAVDACRSAGFKQARVGGAMILPSPAYPRNHPTLVDMPPAETALDDLAKELAAVRPR